MQICSQLDERSEKLKEDLKQELVEIKVKQHVFLLLLEIWCIRSNSRSDGEGKALRVENRREERLVLERRILAKNNDGRQTRSEVKHGRVGLVLEWVTTFK